ncbi:MAG TPA: hypothetical protein H9741_01840 [Candidatus Borkfalkia faecipullorum]|uniref:NfeD-like C-terminal domain-containing protein n=1 Tax=Candidatus Borkfalkia faecipullorum TaxID=2838510 RepID=A0A9D2AEU2_9FIRM|nr:hypothetical protein [Candidatus Borkfalkia faecipullorum]
MFDWLKSLSGLEIAYFIIACIGTVALLIQIILMLIGAGGEADADFDTDTDGDGSLDTHTDTGVSLFTVKGLTAFFAIGGWTGMLMLSYNVGVAITVPVSVVAGLAAYFIVWALIRLVLKLQEDGTLNYASAIGQTATVYVSIPASRTGRGKITLVLQGRYTELDAVTDETERIPVDCAVEITERAGDAFVVRKKV